MRTDLAVDEQRSHLLAQLAEVERLARASRWRRLWAAPKRYVCGMWWRWVGYRLMHRGQLVDTRTFFGAPMLVMLPAGMDLFLLGAKTHDSEIRLARLLVNHLPKGTTVLDVGAHYGYFSLLSAHLVGQQGQVHAFEASPSTFELLQANKGKGVWPQLHVHHLACADRRAKVAFYEFPVAFSEYNTLRPEQYARAEWRGPIRPQRVVVPAIALDEWAAACGCVPQWVKIDVEGAELQVIQGMRRLLEEAEPIIVMEFQSEMTQNGVHRQATALLCAQGYCPYLIDEHGRCVPIGGDVAQAVQHSGLVSENVVFLPSGKSL